MQEQKRVPELRFPEFSGEWKSKRLGEVLTERKVKKKISKETPLLAFAARQGVIDRSERKTNNRDFLTKDSTQKKYLLTKYDDIVYNPSNLKYGAIDRNKHGQGVISPIYVTFETTETPCFIEIIVKSEKFKQIALQYEEGTVIKRQSVKPENLLSLNITIPSLSEQEKIADFLSKVDEKIEKLEKKKELWEDYKKGVMQKIFSLEIRFKDDDGNEFCEWEEKKLEEICNVKTSSLSQNTLEQNFGNYPLYGATGFIKCIDFYEMENNYISIVKDGAGVGRVLFCEGNSSILGTLNYLTNKKNSHIKFVYYLLLQIKFEKYIIGSTIPHIYFKDYSKEKINLPSLPEQKKIADFLSNLDSKIEAIEKEIEVNREFKKGLLQKMFC